MAEDYSDLSNQQVLLGPLVASRFQTNFLALTPFVPSRFTFIRI